MFDGNTKQNKQNVAKIYSTLNEKYLFFLHKTALNREIKIDLFGALWTCFTIRSTKIWCRASEKIHTTRANIFLAAIWLWW